MTRYDFVKSMTATSVGYCYACPFPVSPGDLIVRERVGDEVPHRTRLVHATCAPSYDLSKLRHEEQWVKMFAYVGPAQGAEDLDWWKGKIEFFIQVRRHDQFFHAKILVDENQLKHANFDLYKQILDDVVRDLDDTIEEYYRGKLQEAER